MEAKAVMRALSGVSRVAINIDHHRPCFMLTTISTKQYNFYHWSLLLDNDYIDHHQVRALARAAGPSHVLGSRGKVRSPFSFRVVKLEQWDLLFSCQCCHLTIPKTILSMEIIANWCIILSPAPRDWASLSCTAVRTINSKLPKDVHKWYQGEGKALRPIPIPIDLSTHTKKTLRMQFFITGLVRERGDSSCVHKHWAAQSKGSFFAYSNEYLIMNFNINNICIPAAILIYIANQGRRVRRLRRLHVRRRLLTQLGSCQRHPWHSRTGEGSSPSS